MRIGERGEPDVADRRLASADQDRRAVKQQAIDQVRGEERRRRLCAAFDEQVIDAGQPADVLGRADNLFVTPAFAGMTGRF